MHSSSRISFWFLVFATASVVQLVAEGKRQEKISSTQLTSTTRGTSSSGKYLTSSGTSTTTRIPAYSSSTVLNGTLSTSEVLSYKQSGTTSTSLFNVTDIATVTNAQLTSTSHGVSSSGNTPFSSENSDGISVPTIVGVVIATIIVIAVVSIALIIFKRQRKKTTKKDDTQIADLPKVLANYTYEKSMEITESSNYDTISDESVLNYSLSAKKEKDPKTIPVTVNKYDDVSAEKYDKIKFEMKSAVNAPDYDRLAAVKEKEDYQYSPVPNQSKQEDSQYSHIPNQSKEEDYQYSHIPNQSNEEDYQYSPGPNQSKQEDSQYSHIPNQSKEEYHQYSHVPNQSNSSTSGTAGINDYSLFKPKSNDALRNGDDYTHIEFQKDDTTNLESNISEENPYNHIVLDDNKYQNAK